MRLRRLDLDLAFGHTRDADLAAGSDGDGVSVFLIEGRRGGFAFRETELHRLID